LRESLNFPAVLRRLEAALKGPLPGEAAQALMAPRPRREWPAGMRSGDARTAAGLLVVTPRDGERAHILLTRRAATLGRHQGQVSLPGGAIEPGETLEEAALREAHEEIGLASRHVRVLGALTAIDIPVSGFRLHPIVAAADLPPALTPARGEVAEILPVPLDELLEPHRAVWRRGSFQGRPFEYPAFPVGQVDLWGATAMIVAELLAVLGWPGPTRPPATTL
jgi:8-oxo-dGTP pyrophosphatase MutT (NUDIX family)